MTDRERADRILLSCSLERVINTSMEVTAHAAGGDAPTERIQELADVNHQDWEECKGIAVALWNEARDRAFRRANPDLPLLNVPTYEAGVRVEAAKRLSPKRAVDTAEYWFAAARNPAYTPAERLNAMENALNHTENALVHVLREPDSEITARLRAAVGR